MGKLCSTGPQGLTHCTQRCVTHETWFPGFKTGTCVWFELYTPAGNMMNIDEPNQNNPIQGTATAKTTQNDLKLCLPFLTPFEHVNRLESIIPNNLVENGKKRNAIIYLHIHGKYLSSLNQLPISSCKKLNLDLLGSTFQGWIAIAAWTKPQTTKPSRGCR